MFEKMPLYDASNAIFAVKMGLLRRGLWNIPREKMGSPKKSTLAREKSLLCKGKGVSLESPAWP
jgi:hypothetical protein